MNYVKIRRRSNNESNISGLKDFMTLLASP
jgi:hypothetical protein